MTDAAMHDADRLPIIDDEPVKTIVQLSIPSEHEVLRRSVETIECFRFIEEIGCDKLQGFLISKAVPAGALEELLRR